MMQNTERVFEFLAVTFSEKYESDRTAAPDPRTLEDHAPLRGMDLTLELHKATLMANNQEAIDPP